MLVAVPLFGDEVSPRFGYATEVMLAHVEGRKVHSSRRIAVPETGGMQICVLLISLKPQVVICGGIRRACQRMLEHRHITVIWGIIGRAEDALSSYASGKLKSDQFVCPGRRRFRKGGRGQ